MIKFSHEEVVDCCYKLLGEMIVHIDLNNSFKKYDEIKIYPVPRGGIPIAYIFTSIYSGFEIVNSPEESDIIIDDIIDSGATKERYKKYGKEFFALIDKKDQLITDYIEFPWEISDQDSPVEDNLIRLEQFFHSNGTALRLIREIREEL